MLQANGANLNPIFSNSMWTTNSSVASITLGGKTMNDYNSMLEIFETTHSDETKYLFPFPIVVYDNLCKIPDSGVNWTKYRKHAKCFIPNACPAGMSLTYSKGTSGVAEMFDIEPKDWVDAIKQTDLMNGFIPDVGGWHYLRTLMYVHVLPDNYKEDKFKIGLQSTDLFISNARNLNVPGKYWKCYEKVPCWVYSTTKVNDLSEDVIWCGYKKNDPNVVEYL